MCDGSVSVMTAHKAKAPYPFLSLFPATPVPRPAVGPDVGRCQPPRLAGTG